MGEEYHNVGISPTDFRSTTHERRVHDRDDGRCRNHDSHCEEDQRTAARMKREVMDSFKVDVDELNRTLDPSMSLKEWAQRASTSKTTTSNNNTGKSCNNAVDVVVAGDAASATTASLTSPSSQHSTASSSKASVNTGHRSHSSDDASRLRRQRRQLVQSSVHRLPTRQDDPDQRIARNDHNDSSSNHPAKADPLLGTLKSGDGDVPPPPFTPPRQVASDSRSCQEPEPVDTPAHEMLSSTPDVLKHRTTVQYFRHAGRCGGQDDRLNRKHGQGEQHEYSSHEVVLVPPVSSADDSCSELERRHPRNGGSVDRYYHYNQHDDEDDNEDVVEEEDCPSTDVNRDQNRQPGRPTSTAEMDRREGRGSPRSNVTITTASSPPAAAAAATAGAAATVAAAPWTTGKAENQYHRARRASARDGGDDGEPTAASWIALLDGMRDTLERQETHMRWLEAENDGLRRDIEALLRREREREPQQQQQQQRRYCRREDDRLLPPPPPGHVLTTHSAAREGSRTQLTSHQYYQQSPANSTHPPPLGNRYFPVEGEQQPPQLRPEPPLPAEYPIHTSRYRYHRHHHRTSAAAEATPADRRLDDERFSPGTRFVADLSRVMDLEVGTHAPLSVIMDRHWERLSQIRRGYGWDRL